MAPKKAKMPDIRRFLRKSGDPGSSSSTIKESTQPDKSTGSQPNKPTGSQPDKPTGSQPDKATGSPITHSPKRVKTENDGDSMMARHLHLFKLHFSPTDPENYTIDCDQPRTVLEAIKSTEIYNQKIKCSDENIVIQLGEEDRACIVATHFPCSCIENGETLIISCESEKVEKTKDQPYKPIQSRDKYSVFYIDTVGGLYTRQKRLFKNKALKQFKRLCVYGEKGMTVKEVLASDGRFIDGLSNFKLSNNENPKSLILCTQKVYSLDKKEFKIRLPKNKRASDEKQENPGASNTSQQRCGAVMDVVKQSGISVNEPINQERVSVRTAAAKYGGTDEIYIILREQFPGLKDWMEKRFPADSYQKALELRKEDFGKIQQSFSEVHRVKKLLKLGESVCRVIVQGGLEGTGFVLFDNLVLTNAHVFKGCVEGQKLKEGIDVFFLFNYEEPEPNTSYYYFKQGQPDICYSEGDLDYAVFWLSPEALTNNNTAQTKKMKVPPGLLSKFGPMPPDGEACIIGHPAGGLKKMDPICIIEKEKREQAVTRNLVDCKDKFTICATNYRIKNDPRADILLTYNTFMYHGSSGSPVFDAQGRVFGLHTGGFFYGLPKSGESVIEFGQPLLTIFEHFVRKLKADGKEDLLKRVEKEAKGNSYLKKLLRCSQGPMATGTDDPSAETEETANSDESMETE